MAAAAAGDDVAAGRLLAAHYDRCYAVCRRILSNDDDALDATQEAMIAIARGLRHFDGRSAFSTWCFRVATNSALDELRRRRRRPVVVPEASGADREARSAVAAAGDRVAGLVTARITVGDALGRLPEVQRVAVVLREIADLDYGEIAEVLGIPIGTVRSRIARGRAALTEMLSASLGGGSVDRTGRNPAGDPAVKDADTPPRTDQHTP